MKAQPRKQVTHFQNGNFNHNTKRLQIPQKLVYEKFHVHEEILATRNYRRKFIKNLLSVASCDDRSMVFIRSTAPYKSYTE